jgi:hypothetical protein
MYPEKPNRFWLVSGLLLAIIFTVAFRTGELVELDAYLSNENNTGVVKVSQNVQFIVPKGTSAHVISSHRLISGNYAMEVEIPGAAASGKGAGQRVWILYRTGTGNVAFDKSPQTSKNAQFTRDTPAIAQLINPLNESVALSAKKEGPPVTVDQTDFTRENEIQSSRASQDSRWEKAMPITSMKGRGLASEGL